MEFRFPAVLVPHRCSKMSLVSSRRRWLESGPRLNERMNEWESDGENDQRGNPVWPGNDSSRRRDRPKPLTWTHSNPPPEGAWSPGSSSSRIRSWGQRSRGREVDFFLLFFFPSPETTKRQRTDCTDWQRAVQKVRRVQSDTPQRGKLITHIHEWTEITGDKQGVCFFWTLGKLLRSKGREESQQCSPGDAGVHVRFTRRPQIMWWIRLTGECFSLFLRKTLLFQQSVCVCQLAVFLSGYTRLFLFLFSNPMSKKFSLHQVTISEVISSSYRAKLFLIAVLVKLP